MNATLKKTAAALVASIAIAGGSAFAEPAHTQAQNTDLLLQNLYEQIDQSRQKTQILVLAKAETKVANRLASVSHLPSHRPLVNTFVVAHMAP